MNPINEAQRILTDIAVNRPDSSGVINNVIARSALLMRDVIRFTAEVFSGRVNLFNAQVQDTWIEFNNGSSTDNQTDVLSNSRRIAQTLLGSNQGDERFLTDGSQDVVVI